jgi:phenylalanine-4-hydroxylase
LRLRGRWTADGGVEALAGSLRGEPLALPEAAPLVLAGGLPGVAGGPADPGAWDRWFGQAPADRVREPEASPRLEAEQLAQRRKAEALPAQLAALYEEVARMRRAGRHDPARIEAIRAELVRYPGDWLLREELGELQAQLAS